MANKKKEAFELLWAPWRMEYIRNPLKEEETGCVFCKKPVRDHDKEDLILYRGKKVYVIMNLYPYNNGHIMVVPYRHLSDYCEMSPEERHEISDLTGSCIDILRRVMHPNGFNVGFNLGRTAGAGIDDHIHEHIVPRWSGDTNFMPVLVHTKVVVDGLKETWQDLKQEFNKLKIK